CRTRPLALPGALPCQEFRSSQVKNVPQDGVRTFLPSRLCCGEFTSPLLCRNQRSPGPPANSYYNALRLRNSDRVAPFRREQAVSKNHFVASSFSNSPSVRIVTPSSFAFSYFDPGSAPTTT